MITKQDIVDSDFGLSKTAPENKVNTYIKNHIKKLRSLLPTALYTALESEYDEDRVKWSINKTYATNDKVVHDEDGITKLWKCLSINTGSEPKTSNTTDWDEVDLGTFLLGYVHPYLAASVFLDYAVLGGVNISHQGLQQVANETAEPVTGNKLNAFLNYHRSERETNRVLMLKYLDDKAYSLDGVTYERVEGKRKRRRTGIRAVGYSGPVTNSINRDEYFGN